MTGRKALSLLLLLLLWGCAPSSPTVRKETGFSPRPESTTLFVAPFTTVMVPKEVEEGIFDLFVDALNSGKGDISYEFVILKGGTDDLDREWLAGQHYLTGEIFGYVEDSGCCSTVIRLKSRVQLHQPGSEGPTLRLEYPRETFFDHDYSTVEEERRKLAEDVATNLARQILDALSGP